MGDIVEKNFLGFVKSVIGATGLLAMGSIVAGGTLLKGFDVGANTVKDTQNNQPEKTENKPEQAESPTASNKIEEITVTSSEEQKYN